MCLHESSTVRSNSPFMHFEFFDIDNMSICHVKEWIQNFPILRYHHSAVVGSDGKVYVFGTTSTWHHKRCRTAECYDPGSFTWYMLPPLPSEMIDCAAVSLPTGQIYLFGGHNAKHKSSSDSFCFDLKTQTYSRLADLPIACSSFRAVWI